MNIKDITKEELEKDVQDFKNAFNSYNGIRAGTLTSTDVINWMMTVTDELTRLNAKIIGIIRILNNIPD